MKIRGILLFLAAFLFIPVASADTIMTKDKKRYEGRIIEENESSVTIMTYADGNVTIARSNIQTLRKAKSRFDDYDKFLKKTDPKDVDGHLKVAKYCKSKKLMELMKKHYQAVLALDPTNEKAHKGVGHKQIEGKWVDEAEYYRAKGWIQHNGRWMSPEEKKRIEREAALATIKHRIKMKITFKPNAPKEQLESWEPKVRQWAAIIWDLTAGSVWIESAHISDNSEAGDCVVVNLDSLNIDERGNSGRARTGGRKFWVGGLCNAFVFVHEFFHAWAGVPDHYGTKILCLMNSSERSRIFKWAFCDPCWGKVKRTLNPPRRPKLLEEELPGPTSPGQHGSPEDCGEPPEMTVTVTDS